MYEADQEHRNEVMQLLERLAVLESEASQHEALMNSVIKENREQINKLQEEKALLEVISNKQLWLYIFSAVGGIVTTQWFVKISTNRSKADYDQSNQTSAKILNAHCNGFKVVNSM